MSTVITGIFDSASAAARAVGTLEARGVHAADISLVTSERVGRESFTVDKHSKLAEGAAAGAGIGGAVGALAAGLTLVGAVASGGAGLLVAGPLVAALAGAGAGAAAGSVVGGLVGLAIPEHELKFYEEALERGGVVVAVSCENADTASMVKDVLKERGATKVSSV